MVMAIVIGIMFVVSALALAVLYLMTQESRIAEHKIRRMRVFYAAKAVVVHALEGLRKGDISKPSDTGSTYPIRVGSGEVGYPSDGLYTRIVVGTEGLDAPAGTHKLEATASYGELP